MSESTPHQDLDATPPTSLLSGTWGLAAYAAVLVVGLGAMLPLSAPTGTVTLPIRVYAPNGADPHVEEITLDVDDSASVDSLYVKAHQPFYHRGGNEEGQHEGFDVEGAASIQINDGPWVDVRNENVRCGRSERLHTQCIGGAFSTVRFMIPASNVNAGTNWVRFRFNGTDGIRSGYRVLEVGFMRSSDPPVETFDPQTDGAHDASLLEYEDFSAWTPPSGYDSPSDIADGEQWFTSAQLLESPSGEMIQASCSDCHTQDGRDLKYFNYSNRSIVARSRFHGLSQEQGKQIAAYVRSIRLEKRNGSTYEAPGTPWDPPYQPGPELMATGEHPDASNQVYWASGAGLEWVLNKDTDMLPHLFPGGQGTVDYYTTPNGERALNWKHVHMDSTLNMRALPISAQYPDWNNWLPDIHPKDAFPSQWEGSSVRSIYNNELQSALQSYSGGTNQSELRDIELAVQNMHSGFFKDLENESNLSKNKFINSHLSGHLWLAVKMWESFHTHHLEDVADDMYGDRPDKPFNEPRSWIGAQRTLFDAGPNISNRDWIDGSPPYMYGPDGLDGIMSHIWYQLQVTVNPGAGNNSTQKPIDWNYHNAFLKGAPDAGLRAVASRVKANQMLSNGLGVDGSGGNGYDQTGMVQSWEPFTVDPARFMKLRNASGAYGNLPSNLREDLYTATLRAWNEYVLRFPIEEYPRGSDIVRYNPSDYVPPAWGNGDPHDHARKIYQELVHIGDQFPESYGARDTLAAWGAQMWPTTDGPDWENLVDYLPPGEGSPPSLTVTAPFSELPASGPDVTITPDVSDPDGNVDRVDYFVGDSLIATAEQAPYEVSWTDVPYNTYRMNARVRDEANLVDRDTLTFTVGPSTPPDLDDHGLYYAYDESDWLRHEVPNFETLIPMRGGTAPAFKLSALDGRDKDFVARFFGYIDIPEDGTYTFYTMSSDGSILSIDGQEVVNNDDRHVRQERSGQVTLTAGRHFIELGYFMRGGQKGLRVSWSGPGIAKTEIPTDRLYRKGPLTRIPLEQGWNVLSSRVVPDASGFQTALETIASDISIVKDENGNGYVPDYDIREMETWSAGHGYKVHATTNTTLLLRGAVLDVDTPIALKEGWNVVSYLPSTSMPPEEAFQSISDHLVAVKDNDGNTFDPSSNIDDIGAMTPGQGYLVYVDQATELIYPRP